MSNLILWTYRSPSGTLQTLMCIASEYLCGKVPFFILQIFDLRHKGAYAVCDKPVVDEELSFSVSSILALTRLSFLTVLMYFMTH